MDNSMLAYIFLFNILLMVKIPRCNMTKANMSVLKEKKAA
jgi:hypothetical protein